MNSCTKEYIDLYRRIKSFVQKNALFCTGLQENYSRRIKNTSEGKEVSAQPYDLFISAISLYLNSFAFSIAL